MYAIVTLDALEMGEVKLRQLPHNMYLKPFDIQAIPSSTCVKDKFVSGVSTRYGNIFSQ